MVRRLYLHIGAPKTGTTFLQSVLWEGRERWPESGVAYPLADPKEHFRATGELRGLDWGGDVEDTWAGAWRTVATRLQTSFGDAVFSHELLAGATPEEVARIAATFPHHELHIVLTLRSIPAMLASDWQEQVKHRHTASWEQYLGDVLDNPAETHFGRWFHANHDALDVLARWAPVASAGQVHVVINDRPSETRLLWERFASVLGLPGDVDLPADRQNVALGKAATDLLAAVNVELSDLSGPAYADAVGGVLVEDVLPRTFEKTPVTFPADRAAQVTAWNTAVVEGLRELKVDVVGDLDALLTPAPAETDADEAPTADAKAVAAKLREVAELQARARELS